MMDTNRGKLQEWLAFAIAFACIVTIFFLISQIRSDFIKHDKHPAELITQLTNELSTRQNYLQQIKEKRMDKLIEELTTQIGDWEKILYQKYPNIPLTFSSLWDRSYITYRGYKPARELALDLLDSQKKELKKLKAENLSIHQSETDTKKCIANIEERIKTLNDPSRIEWTRRLWSYIRPVFHGGLALGFLGILFRVVFRLALLRGWFKPGTV